MIHIYGSETCKKCIAAKDKLKKMGFNFVSHNLAYHIAHHDGWQDDDSVNLMVFNIEQDGHMPFIKIDNEYYDYSKAMKKLKRLKKKNVTHYS